MIPPGLELTNADHTAHAVRVDPKRHAKFAVLRDRYSQ